jgi:hypothetical protein
MNKPVTSTDLETLWGHEQPSKVEQQLTPELIESLKRVRAQMDHMLATQGYIDINALDPEARSVEEKANEDQQWDAKFGEDWS